jgi:hypothetical protein
MRNAAKDTAWQYCHGLALREVTRSPLCLPPVEPHSHHMHLSLVSGAAQKPNQRFQREAVQLSFAQVADARLIGSDEDGDVPRRSLSCEAYELAR